MTLHDHLNQRLDRSADVVASLRDQMPQIVAVCDTIVSALQNGGTLYTCGNGGSAAQAMHLSEELIGRYCAGDRPALPAICLNADPAAMTCIANDFGFEHVFARQCEALLTERDVLVGLSTSGSSENIVNALITARTNGAATVGILGKGGGACLDCCNQTIVVAGEDSAQIQESHLVIVHLICEAVECAFNPAVPIGRSAHT